MLIEEKIMEKYSELNSSEQLSLFNDSSLFVLFKSDFSILDTNSLNGIPRVVGYWPKENQVKLYNPNTKRVANAMILTKKEVAKILNSKSFHYYWIEYHIFFSCFIIDKSELDYFDSQIVVANIEKKKQEKTNQDKIKENEIIRIINTNELVIEELCNYAFALCDYLMKKVIFQNNLLQNGFKKLFTNLQLSFIQNIMWIFFNQIIDLKPETFKFINKSIFKYIYNHQLLEYAMLYLNTNLSLKQNNEKNYIPNKNNKENDICNYNHFIRIITNKSINEKLLNCYKTNLCLLSKTLKKWKVEGWGEESLEVDVTLPPNSKNITYNATYLDRILYGQIKLIAYQMNQIILENFWTLYH